MVSFVILALFIAFINGATEWLNVKKKEFAIFIFSFLSILATAKLPVVMLINDLDYILPQLVPWGGAWVSSSWLMPSLVIIFIASAWQLTSVTFSNNILRKYANALLILIFSTLALFISLGLFWVIAIHENTIIIESGGFYYIALHFFRAFSLFVIFCLICLQLRSS